MVEHNARNRFSTYICFLDIANAFPSVPLELLFGLLGRHGASPNSIELLKNLHFNCSNMIHVGDLQVGPFPVNKGVRQGYFLSMLLYDIVIDPVLLAVDPIQESFNILAYADDIVIVNTSFE